jgi:hypothetical protein
MVDITSNSVSVLWNMLSVGCLLLARITDLLSHTYFTKRMLIKPDRARVPRIAKPAASPPNSDRHEVMSRGSPSSGPPHVSSMSLSDVAITQLWYPNPNSTDPSVATIMSFGSVISHPLGVSRIGMLPTNRCTCFGNACMHLPMLDMYVLMGVGCASTQCVTSSWYIISTYRALSLISIMWVNLVGMSQGVPSLKNLRRPMFCDCLRSHCPFV